jgi:hypothetical protein
VVVEVIKYDAGSGSDAHLLYSLVRMDASGSIPESASRCRVPVSVSVPFLIAHSRRTRHDLIGKF